MVESTGSVESPTAVRTRALQALERYAYAPLILHTYMPYFHSRMLESGVLPVTEDEGISRMWESMRTLRSRYPNYPVGHIRLPRIGGFAATPKVVGCVVFPSDCPMAADWVEQEVRILRLLTIDGAPSQDVVLPPSTTKVQSLAVRADSHRDYLYVNRNTTPEWLVDQLTMKLELLCDWEKVKAHRW